MRRDGKGKAGLVRRAAWVLLTAAVVWCAAFPAWADGERAVYDYAGLLDEDQIRQLEEEAAQVREQTDLDVVIMTTLDAEGKTAQAWADDAYDEGGFGVGNDHSGILYLMDMDNRELTLSTAGKAIRIFTDQRIETILDHVYEEASEGDFGASAQVFLEDVRYYAKQGVQSGQYNYDPETGRISIYRSIRWYEALLAAVVSAVVAGGAVAAVKSQYKMEANQRQIDGYNMAYRADSQFEFADTSDQLMSRFVTTSLIAAGAAAAASAAGRRGGSHSGRSTVHRSGGGRSHGGGSRRL